MNLSVQGTVDQILTAESGTSQSGKEWQKQEFVIETKEQYPKKVCFTLFGDKMKLIDGLLTGQLVDVSFNLESREYNGKWFHNVNAWKIEVQKTANETIRPDKEESYQNDMPDRNEAPPIGEDDLPF